MSTNRSFDNVQLFTDFTKDITGATKLADSILFSNLEPDAHTTAKKPNANIAVSFAKIYSWVDQVFDFTPAQTQKVKIKTAAIPDIDTTYSFAEGSVNGAFQVTEEGSAAQNISVHNALWDGRESGATGGALGLSLGAGTATNDPPDKLNLTATKNSTTGIIGSVTLGLLESSGTAPNLVWKIKSQFLPSYVDDVVEAYYDNGDFYTDPTTHTSQTKITPETGKIYVDLNTNSTYRWGGSTYVKISDPVDVMTGATSSVAGKAGLVPAPAAGDQGKYLRGDGTWQTVSFSDTKVTQNKSTTNKNYPVILSYYEVGSSTTTAQVVYRNDSVYVNPSTGALTAADFVGKLNGMTITGTSGSSYNLDTAILTYSLSTGTTYNSDNTAQTVTLSDSASTPTTQTATIAAMTGATSSAAGKAGLVPKPATGNRTQFLRGDGSWQDPIADIGILELICTNGVSS